MKIFISHSSKDAAYGKALVTLLTGVGVAHESIVFTSDTTYGVPNSANIFDWLKQQISDKPFVIFLLSPDYYRSIPCLNEMGAAWIIENQHATIFTRNFDLKDERFRDGALDPRRIGFFIDDAERVAQFIASLGENFEITSKQTLINRKCDDFIAQVRSINSLSGVSSEPLREDAVSPQSPTEDNKASTETLSVPTQPSELKEFEFQFILGLVRKNEAHSQEVSETYLASLGPDDHDAQGEWNSFCELMRLKWSDQGDLSKLTAIADEHKRNPIVHKRVAAGYLHFDHVKKAQNHLRVAIEFSTDPNRKIGLLGELAKIAAKQGSGENLSACVAEMRAHVDGPDTESLLLANLSNLSDWYQDDVLKAAIMERELSIDPTDTSRRFELAYLHSQTGSDALSMFHYEKIPANQRSGTTWNNLGVTYRNLSINGKSVSSFRKAEEKGETLAMSNLAYEFMEAGFLSEASQILRKALSDPNPHDNVTTALVRLNEIRSEETQIHKDKSQGVSAKSSFLSHVGEYLWQDGLKNFPKKIIDPDCELDVTIKGKQFVATGAFQRSDASLVSALAGTSSPTETANYTVEYRGRLVGKVAIGERTKRIRSTRSAPSSLFDFSASQPRFIIVMPEGERNVRGMIGADLFHFELLS